MKKLDPKLVNDILKESGKILIMLGEILEDKKFHDVVNEWLVENEEQVTEIINTISILVNSRTDQSKLNKYLNIPKLSIGLKLLKLKKFFKKLLE